MGALPRKLAHPITQDSLYQFIEDQNRVLAHQITFGSTMGNTDEDNNMGCWKAVGNTGVAANTEFFILHNLTRIPIMFIGFIDQAGTLYSYYGGMTPWTKATNAGNDGKIFLKCTAANANYRVIIF
jgi:hypothetical protein